MTSPTTDRRYGVNSGLAFKAPCRAATTGNITLSGEQTIDGVALVTGDRCLVVSQTSSINNGVYVVDTGAWSRDVDFDGSRDIIQGTLIYVYSGTTYGQSTWQVTSSNPITIGSSNVTFSLANSATLTAALAASTGSGLVGFLYSLTYGAGTIGKWLKDLATSTGSTFIGFIQAGTGAVLRTMQDKNRDFINAADFGFSTSASSSANKTALVAALASLGSTGGTIFINKGTYSIDPGIALSMSQKSITICGAANAMGYEDNSATAATVLNFTTGSIGLDLSAEDATVSAGCYIRVSNLCIKGGGVLAYGIKANGLVLLDHMNVSTCTTAGIWFNEFINMASLDYVSCSGNTGAYGLLVGAGATTLKDNTIFHASNSVFRQNLVGVRIEQAVNYSFDNCVIESNAHEGLVLYRVHTGTGHDQNTNGRFNTCWFENNSASDDVHANFLSDAGTRSTNTLDTPSYMTFENCTFTCSVTATPGTFKPNVQIDCGNYFDFNNCNIQTTDPLNDGATKAPVLLNTYAGNMRFYNLQGNYVFTDSGTNNCTALSSYYKEGSFTITLTGCTATITGTAYYTKIGNVVTIDLPTLSGTSNATTKTLTGLPSILSATSLKILQFFGSDSGGAYGTGMSQLSSGTFTLYKDGSGNGWTGSGAFAMRAHSITYTMN